MKLFKYHTKPKCLHVSSFFKVERLSCATSFQISKKTSWSFARPNSYMETFLRYGNHISFSYDIATCSTSTSSRNCIVHTNQFTLKCFSPKNRSLFRRFLVDLSLSSFAVIALLYKYYFGRCTVSYISTFLIFDVHM